MNPLLQAALGSLLRWLFAIAAGFFVEHGIWTQGEASSYVAGAALAVLSLLWSLWAKYHSRIKFLTALEVPAGSSEADVKATIAAGQGASVLPPLSVPTSKLPLIVLAAALSVGIGITTGCARQAQPQLSPAGHAAVTATQLIQALDVVRDVAINANAQVPPLISTADTRTIVNWHESAVKTLIAVPSGWKATIRAGLVQLQADLPSTVWDRLAPYITLINTLIAGAL